MRTRVWTVTLALLVCALPALAKTPDGQPPSVETVCDGQKGAAFGLCNAYCEAMDCDSPAPHASPKACAKVRSNYEKITGSPLFPCDASPCPCSAELPLFADFESGAATINFCIASASETTVGNFDGQSVIVLSFGCQANGEDPFVELTEDEAAACSQILLDAAVNQGVECQTPE